jgi:hypothetical protein
MARKSKGGESEQPGAGGDHPGTATIEAPAQPNIPDNEEKELTAAEAAEYQDTLDAKLRTWVEATRYENTQSTCTLYRFDHPTTGEDKSQCNQWTDEIPDAHTIGITYGPGRYLLLVTVPRSVINGKPGPRAIKGYRFRIHPYYDELRRRASQDAGYPVMGYGPRPGAGAGPMPAGMDAMSQGLGMVREVLQIVSPLLRAKEGSGDMAAMMMRNYSMMNDVMRKNMIESQELMADSIRSRPAGPVQDRMPDDGAGDDDDPPQPTLIEQITPLLNTFVPLILGKGPAGTVAVEAVKAMPQFQQMTADSGELRKLVSHLDKTIGKEKVDGLLKRLKVTRPK